MFQEMIEAIIEERDKNTYKPKILIKFSPDESLETYKELLSVINASEIDGVIITNTTNNGELKNNIGMKDKPGGISGKLLREPSNKILKVIKTFLNPEKIIVAVGGVYDVDSYNEKIDLGADLVQMYTGLIYEGPSLVKRIVKNDK
jgi:dihydroorotate dehydrogenase